MSLTEVLIGLSIAIGLSAAAFSYLTNVEQYRVMVTRASTRDAIAKRIETQLRAYRNVEYSGITMASAGPSNTRLGDCLDRLGANCVVRSAGSQESFDFFVNQGAAGPIRLAGTESNPVLYNYNGQPNCDPAEAAGCPAYKAVAYFWGTCAGTPCPQATSVSVRYQVTPLKELQNGKTLPATPQDAAFNANKSRFAVTHLVRDKTLNHNDCPAGAWQVGFESDGKPKCQCSYAHTQVPGSNPIVCVPSGSTCPKGQVARGVDSKGKPECYCMVPNCRMETFDVKSAQCPNGGWLERLDMGYCAEKLGSGSKSNKQAIGCQRNRGLCCQYTFKLAPPPPGKCT
jgi:hypothetical protein